MTETIVTGEEATIAVLEELKIEKYNCVRVFDGDREVMLHDLKIVVYIEDEELEKFECEDCGCYFMVKDRDGFDCPNCSSDSNIQTLQVGDKTYSAKEYETGEFGIYNMSDELCADCFESVEQAQEWLKTRCCYCETMNESTHFICEACGIGMCDDCYDSDKEHSQHYHMPLEECEGQQVDLIKKVCSCENPQYICEACMKKALSLKQEDFAKKANKILEGSNLKAEIIETSELYGENDDEVEEDQYYMQPMYEGYIEDAEEEEIDNSRTGRYCSLESVSEELEAFAYDKKIGFIAYETQKLIGTQWKNKQEIENYLQKTFKIEIELKMTKNRRYGNHSFIGKIFEEFGFIEIYYSKILSADKNNDKTIKITDFAVSYV